MTPDLCLPACFFMMMLPRNGSCVGSPYCCVDHSVIDIRLPVSFLNDLESQTGFEPMLRGSFCGALMPDTHVVTQLLLQSCPVSTACSTTKPGLTGLLTLLLTVSRLKVKGIFCQALR